MTLDFSAFAFIFTLAAVVNGLGIVRWLSGFSEYLRKRDDLAVDHYWVFNVFAAFQFLLHILLWWSLWAVRAVETFNFLHYLYLLTGPILLFLASSLLIPDLPDGQMDVRKHYYRVRRSYATILACLWVWVIFLWPVMRGVVEETTPFTGAFLIMAVVQRISSSPKVQGTIAILNWVLLLVFISLYSMQLGGVARHLL
jgi:hypothetical protein